MEIQRYEHSIHGLDKSDDGDWVEWRDVEHLADDIARYKSLNAELVGACVSYVDAISVLRGTRTLTAELNARLQRANAALAKAKDAQ